MERTIKSIIEETLKKVDLYSKEAADLKYETGNAESRYMALEQMGGGPALGFFQCEPATMHDCIDNYIKYRPEFEKHLLSLGFMKDDPEFSLKTNIAIQGFFCRIKYRRDKDPIPKTIQERAKYWKKVYRPSGSSLELLSGGKVVLETTDVLKIDCSVADKISGTLSIMEIT